MVLGSAFGLSGSNSVTGVWRSEFEGTGTGSKCLQGAADKEGKCWASLAADMKSRGGVALERSISLILPRRLTNCGKRVLVLVNGDARCPEEISI